MSEISLQQIIDALDQVIEKASLRALLANAS